MNRRMAPQPVDDTQVPDQSGPVDGRPEGDPLDCPGLPPAGRTFLDKVVKGQLVGRSAAGHFLRSSAHQLEEFADSMSLGHAMIQAGLLTEYQLDRVLQGTIHGLILGNHRVLDKLGAGSMGVVFLAEHMLLKRRVAIKVLPFDEGVPQALLERFYSEMRVLADQHHPNIVMAFDAGKLPPPTPNSPSLHYLVMEWVQGGDVENYVIEKGPLPITQGCDMIRQAACGLQEAHDHHLIHRDIKPSNLLLSPEGQVKLVDFGLARQFCSQLTDPSCLLGSLEFMAPEQSIDPSAVDGQADIYGLGASLFWMLTGQPPYEEERSLARALKKLQCEPPRRLRDLRPDAPVDLDNLIARMMDRDPAHRPARAVAVMHALSRFATPEAPAWEIYDPDQPAESSAPAADPSSPGAETSWRVLIVDQDPVLRQKIRVLLESLGSTCGEAESGQNALTLAREEPYGVILLSLDLPDILGFEVCSRLRVQPPRPHLKVMILSEGNQKNDLAKALGHGADDCLTKPIDYRQLSAKLQYLLRLKDAQDRADWLARHLRLTNRQLEDSLQARGADVRQAHDAILFAMAKLGELKDGETAGHCRRLQLYVRTLADHLVRDPGWAGILTGPFLELVERCVPLHDIGKIGLPDQVLSKPGFLDETERALVQNHTLIGANMLDALAQQYGESIGFLTQATIIVRHHHERYDGKGYPDGLIGDAIPPAARLVAMADVYDALRRRRFHKAPMSHEQAVEHILTKSAGQFDPAIQAAFGECHDKFQRIYQQIRD